MSKKADRKKRQDQKRHDQEKRSNPPPSTEPPPAQTTTHQPAAPTQPTEAPDRWKRLSTVWANLGGVGLLGLIVAVIGILYTHHQAEINGKALKELQRQNDLTERNQKRLTGEIAAKMQLASATPEREHFNESMKTKAFGLPDVPYFKNIEAFLLLGRTAILNNVGDEPIEAIKLVTTCKDADLDKGIEPKLTVNVRSEEQEEIILPQQWLPGTAIEVSLVKGILAQMAHLQMMQPPDVLHRAFFETRVYGKITGSTVYGNSENKMVLTWIVWLPSGFPDNKCRHAHDHFRQRIKFGPKQPVTVLTATDMADAARQIKAKKEGRPK